MAERAGVSPSLMYRYFRSKGDLVAAVVEQVFERFDEAVMRPDLHEVPGDWLARERERVRRFVTFFYDDPLAQIAVRASLATPEAVAALQARRSWQAEAAAGNLRRGQASGDLDPDIDPEVTGAFLMGGLFDALGLAVSADPPWDQARVQRHLERLLVQVTAPRAPHTGFGPRRTGRDMPR